MGLVLWVAACAQPAPPASPTSAPANAEPAAKPFSPTSAAAKPHELSLLANGVVRIFELGGLGVPEFCLAERRLGYWTAIDPGHQPTWPCQAPEFTAMAIAPARSGAMWYVVEIAWTSL